MKKKKVSLRNTVRHIAVEYCSYRSASNRELYTFNMRAGSSIYREEANSLAMIAEILECLRGRDVYKLRIVYKYARAGTRKYIKTARSQYFYVAGKVAEKAEVVDWFSFNTEEQKRISALKGDKVFWVHYQIEPLSEKNNYEHLPFFTPELAEPRLISRRMTAN